MWTSPQQQSRCEDRAGNQDGSEPNTSTTGWTLVKSRHGLELIRDIARRMGSQLAILLQTMAQDALQRRIHIGRWRIAAQHRMHRFHRRRTAKCGPATEHLVQDRAKREDVRSRIDLLAAHLFR